MEILIDMNRQIDVGITRDTDTETHQENQPM